jgi:hypothetical protein
VRPLVRFVSSCLRRTGASGSDISSSPLLSRGHGRLSKSPAPQRHGALLLPLRGPPGFRFPPKKIGSAGRHLFRFLRKMQSLAWGAGATCPRVPRERAGQKRRFTSCIRTAFHSSASSVTTRNSKPPRMDSGRRTQCRNQSVVEKLEGRLRLAHRMASLHGMGQARRVCGYAGKRRTRSDRGRTALSRVQERSRERCGRCANQAPLGRDSRQPHPEARSRGKAGRAWARG